MSVDPNTSSPTAPDRPDSACPPRRRRYRVARILLLVVLVLIGAVLVTGLQLGLRLEGHLTRIPDVFTDREDRPAAPEGRAAGAVTILLLGSDRDGARPRPDRTASVPTWEPGQGRSDTTMLLRVAADRSAVSVVSLPRDSWVDVPGYGPAKLNAAYSWGGPRLAVHTVEQLTGVRIDHVAVIDASGFRSLVDGLGGVEVDIPETVHDHYRDRTWTAGRHHLDGSRALLYARERSGLTRGDLDRVRRQHAVLRHLSDEGLEAVGDPVRLYRFVDRLTQHLAVDAEWGMPEMAALAWSLRDLRPGDVDYLTVPVAGTGTVAGQSVVHIDQAAASTLWHALRSDTVSAWVRAHPGDVTGSVVR